jgi:hypothetical protein
MSFGRQTSSNGSSFIKKRKRRMRMKIMSVSKTAVVTRGMFGFVRFNDNDTKHPAIVEHVFSDGRLGVHYSGNKQFHAVISPNIFSPSRDAYWCEGSWVEPEWEDGTAKCLNYWMEPGFNTRSNLKTDDQYLEFVTG